MVSRQENAILGTRANEIEEDIYNKRQLFSSSEEGETSNLIAESPILHNNEAINETKVQIEQLKVVTEKK